MKTWSLSLCQRFYVMSDESSPCHHMVTCLPFFSASGTYRLICKVLSTHSSISIAYGCVFTLTIADSGRNEFSSWRCSFFPINHTGCLPRSNNELPDSEGSKMNPTWCVTLVTGIFYLLLCNRVVLSCH